MKLYPEFFVAEFLPLCNVGQVFYLFQCNGYAKFRKEDVFGTATCLYSNVKRYKAGKGHEFSDNFCVSLYVPPFSTTIGELRSLIGTKDMDLEFQYNGKTVPFCEALITNGENPRIKWVSCSLGQYLDKKYFPEREKWYVPTIQLFLDMVGDFKDGQRVGFEVFQSSGVSSLVGIDRREVIADQKTIIHLS